MRVHSFPPQCIVFDFDGTLATLKIDFDHMRAHVTDYVTAYGIPPAILEGRYILEMIAAGTSYLLTRNPKEASRFQKEAEGAIRFIEITAARNATLIRGVEDMLSRLRASGIKTAIVTRNCLAAVEITCPSVHRTVDLVLTRDDVTHVKPHPHHLLSILQTFDVSPPRAVMVGDHPLDITMGKELGTVTIGVLTGAGRREELKAAKADYILETAADIMALLDMGH